MKKTYMPIKRVILLSHGFQSEYECGFSNGLARNGVNVTLIGSDNSLLDRLEPSVNFLNMRGSQDPNRTAWRKAINMLVYWIRYLIYLLRHRGTPVHVIGLFSLPNLWVSLCEAWLTRLFAGPYILTIHNLMPHDRHSSRTAALCRLIYHSAGLCVVHTQRMRDELALRYKMDSMNVFVMEHGIDRIVPREPKMRSEMRARLDVSEDRYMILFFGQIAPYKGLDVLFKAYDMLHGKIHIKLVIAGRCRNAPYKNWIKGEIDARKETDNILWLDEYVPDEKVALLFNAADMLVMPYKHIDQSGVVFMALSMGLPIVATDVGSLRDYVTHGGVVVPPGSPEALAGGVIELLDSLPKKDYQTRVVCQQYLWSNTVKTILPLYSYYGIN